MDKFAGGAAKGCLIGVGVLSLIISTVFCGMYWDMWSDVQTLNDLSATAGYKGDIPAYDKCGADLTSDGYDAYTTNWTTLLALNSCCYLILSIATFFIVMSALWAPIAICGVCIHICGGCLHFATVIVTGVFRYSTEGEACANQPGDVFGEKIQNLFISQCVLYCFYGCCTGMMIQFAILNGGLSMIKRG